MMDGFFDASFVVVVELGRSGPQCRI